MSTIITKAEEYNREEERPTWIGEIEKLKEKIEALEKKIAELEAGMQRKPVANNENRMR